MTTIFGPTEGQNVAAKSLSHPVGFWHKDLGGVRLHIIKLWCRTTLILSIAILGILSLYWGALFRTENNESTLGVFVVDFDGQVDPYSDTVPLVGPAVIKGVNEIIERSTPHPGFHVRSPLDFDNDPMRVREAVYDFKAWAAIIINSNATALLQQAIQLGNSSYDPCGAAQIILLTARDSTTVNGYIAPAMVAFDKHMTASFSRNWTSTVIRNASVSQNILQTVPQALSPAIGFTFIDIRPFGPSVITPAVTVGLIYLIVIAFFSFSFFLPIHMKYLSPVGHPPLHFHQQVIWRWVATVSAYFVLSLCYSLISLAFQVPFSRRGASHTEPAINPDAYHHATFLVYWMLNFVGMNALGLACENVAMVAGNPWTAIWLIFWIITNVSTAFYSINLASGFYHWGYAWPLHNLVEATRSILFDLHSRLGLNFGVLISWWVINTVVFPFSCYFMRWKSMRDAKLAETWKAQWIRKMETHVTNT
ncbi:MNNG and nitrosoguanidine resistance protein [Halenospora varia]|nr:MNNG and nitrosoguanidine resistance protein [Halenospora varia]